jgi:acetyl esterase/lipase
VLALSSSCIVIKEPRKRAQLLLGSGIRSPRPLVAVVCAAAIAWPGLVSASPALAVSGPAWVKDTNVAYQARAACSVPGTASDTYGDVYRPASPPPGPLPVVVYVHGGAFVGGTRTATDNEVIAEELATLGYVTYNIDYCLADPGGVTPVAGFPMQVLDVEYAVQAVSTPGFDSGRVDVDPGRVAIWGGSAGATLAAEAGVALGDTGITPVAAVVGWSGAYDFLDFQGQSTQDAKDAEAFLGCDPQALLAPGSCLSLAQQGSAALNVTATTPPMSLWNSVDELVPFAQLQDMVAALDAADIFSDPNALPGSRHSNAYTHEAFCPTVAFLTRYLGPYTGTCIAPPDGSGAD